MKLPFAGDRGMTGSGRFRPIGRMEWAVRRRMSKIDPIESLDQRENRRADREKRTTEILRQWTGNQTVKRPFNLVAGLQLLL